LCEGLCPHCGQNFNIAECRCHERELEESSFPFAALANMLNTSDSTVEASDLAEDKSTNHSQAYQSMNHITLRR